MEKYCPHCNTAMINRCDVYICPRNIIGECRFEGHIHGFKESQSESSEFDKTAPLKMQELN